MGSNQTRVDYQFERFRGRYDQTSRGLLEILDEDGCRFSRLSNVRMLKEVEANLLSFFIRFVSQEVTSKFSSSGNSIEERGMGVMKERDEIDKFFLHDRLRLDSSNSTLADPALKQ